MSHRYLYDGILESYKAAEIAEKESKNHGTKVTEEQAAKEWFENVIYGGEGSFQDMPTCHNFVDVIDEDWDLYYDYGAEYYFAVNNKMHEEDES